MPIPILKGIRVNCAHILLKKGAMRINTAKLRNMVQAEPKGDEKKRRSLKYSTIEGAMYNVMAGLTDNYINPFAIALGASNSTIGLIRSIPPLLVSVAQPFALRISALFRSRKQYIMAVVFLQAASLLLLVSIPHLFRENAELMLLLFFSAYSILAPMGMPVWTSWMADLVPEGIRGRYFGHRNMVGGIATFAAILFGGFLLAFFGKDVFLGFSLLYILASIFRLLSFASFTRIEEPQARYSEGRLNVFGFLREVRNNEFGLFLFYYCLLIFSTAIAGFFFSVYMIRNLGFSYYTYAIIEGIYAIAMLAGNSYWGKVIDRFGNKLVLSVTGLMVPFVPLLWLMSGNPVILTFAEIFSGFAWAGMNLALFNYVIGFGSLKNKTAQYTANFNFFQGIAVFIGAIIGAFLVEGTAIHNLSGIPLVFMLSGILRLVAGIAFLPLIKEFKSVENFHGNALLNFGFYMPARNLAYNIHSIYSRTETFSKKAVRKIRYRI